MFLPIQMKYGGEMVIDDCKCLMKILILACVLDIFGLSLIIISILKLTPITIIVSITLGGSLILIAIVLYCYVVIRELRIRKVL